MCSSDLNDTCKLESKKERSYPNKSSPFLSDKSSSSSDHWHGSTDEQETRHADNDTFLFPDIASLHHHLGVEYFHDPLKSGFRGSTSISLRNVVNRLDAPQLNGLGFTGEEKVTGAGTETGTGTGTGKVPHPDDFRRRLVPHADIFSRPLPVFLPPPDDAEWIEAANFSKINNVGDAHIQSTGHRDNHSDKDKCKYYPALVYEMIGGVMCVFNEKDRNNRIQKRNVSNITSNNNSDKSRHDDDNCCHGDGDSIIDNMISNHHDINSMSISNSDNPSNSDRFSVSNSSNMSKNNSEISMKEHNEEIIRKNREIGNLFPVLSVDEFVKDFNYVSE